MTDQDKNETDVKRKKRLIKEWLEVISELQMRARDLRSAIKVA